MSKEKFSKVQCLGQMLYQFAILIDSSKAKHYSQFGILLTNRWRKASQCIVINIILL